MHALLNAISLVSYPSPSANELYAKYALRLDGYNLIGVFEEEKHTVWLKEDTSSSINERPYSPLYLL